MELEELKKQWAEMSKELEQQKIINRQIVDNPANQRQIIFNSTLFLLFVWL